MYYKNIVSFFLGFLGILTFFVPNATFASSGTFDLSTYNVAPDTDFTVVIDANDLIDIGTVDFRLQYDPAVITYVSTVEGPLMQPISFLGMVDITTDIGGGVEELYISVPSEDSITGSGELVTITFHSSATGGTTGITMTEMVTYEWDFPFTLDTATAPGDVTVKVTSGSFSQTDYSDTPIDTDFTITVNMVGLHDTGTVDLRLQYDPTVITYVSTVEGTLMDPISFLGIIDITTDIGGGVEELYISIPSDASISGDGELATITFHTSATEGSTMVSMASLSTFTFDAPFTEESAVTSSTDVTVSLITPDITPPTITSVSSNKTNGYYTTGEVIDIDVTFSENVTSTGNVTVTLETGATDRTCTFTVTNASVGTCNYTVQSTDTTSDLTVNTIAGTIADTATNAMVNFVPATNLATNKALVIDTTLPTITVNSGTDAGPTGDDTINLTAVDTNLNASSLVYGFSANNTCDASDTYGTSFTNSTNFHITTAHTDYLCSRATDLAGNIRYQLVGQLNVETTPPTITSVSSNKTNGYYTTGEVIDIDVTFSENVTSTGNVTVTLETGATDRTCTFTVTNASVGTCNYTVQSTDTTSDLTVNTIAGTIADTATNAMVNFVPATNLATNKALVIDTTLPTITVNSGTDAGPTGDDTINLTAVDTNLNASSLVYGFSANNTCDASDTYGTSFTNSTNFHITTAHTDYLCSRATDLAGNIRYQLVGQLNVADIAPPVRSSASPSGALSSGTTNTTLSVTTNENATCKYGTTSATAFASIANTFSTTGGTSHSQSISGLTNGTSYTYYVRCEDGTSNENTDDYTISFSVANPSTSSSGGGGSSSKDTSAPRNISIVINDGDVSTTVRTVELTLTARDENKIYMQISEQSSFANASWVTFKSSHTWTFSQGNGVRTLYARFKDSKENVSLATTDTITLSESGGIAYVAPQTQQTPSVTTSSNGHQFKLDMGMGAGGSEVVALQKQLRSEGFFTYPTDSGYYGSITAEAVRKYQVHHGITPASGYVGPLTRAQLNKGGGGLAQSSSSSKGISLEAFVRLLIAIGVISQEKAQLALTAVTTL